MLTHEWHSMPFFSAIATTLTVIHMQTLVEASCAETLDLFFCVYEKIKSEASVSETLNDVSMWANDNVSQFLLNYDTLTVTFMLTLVGSLQSWDLRLEFVTQKNICLRSQHLRLRTDIGIWSIVHIIFSYNCYDMNYYYCKKIISRSQMLRHQI